MLVASALCAAKATEEPSGYGVCIWQNGVPPRVVDGLFSCDDSHEARGAESEFLRHSVRHGWCTGELSALVEPARPRHPCPASAVDELARNDSAQSGTASSVMRIWLADFLAHNDRVDEALAILEGELTAVRLRAPREPSRDCGYRHPETSKLAAGAARIAALGQRWDRALDYMHGWEANSHCGTCAESMDAHMKRLRAHWQIERGDFAGARSVLSQSARGADSGGGNFSAFFDPCSGEQWIESWVREGQASAQVLEDFRNAARAEGSERIDPARHWEVLHMSDDAKLDHIEQLDGLHDDLIIPLLRSASSATIESLLARVSADDLIYGRGHLANALAYCGRSEVAALLERELAREPESSPRFGWLQSTLWTAVEIHAEFFGGDQH